MNVAQEQGDNKIKTAQWMILLVERKELKQKKAQWIVPSAHGYFYRNGYAAKNTFRKFYARYTCCSEIQKKENRPYACLTIEFDGLLCCSVPAPHKATIRVPALSLSDEKPSIKSKYFEEYL